MYVLIVTSLFTLFIFYGFGHKIINILDETNSKSYNLFDKYYLGICIVGTIINLWSIFFPSNIVLTIILFILSLFFLRNKIRLFNKYFIVITNYLKENKIEVIYYFLITILILLISMTLPRLYDSYLYHINAIQWNEKYRAIPGLANLHDRFGFNSSIFTLNAVFSYSAIYNQMLFIVNSLSYYVFLIWIVYSIFQHRNFISFISILFIYIFTEQYLLDISSPGTDILINIFISYIGFTFLYNEKSFLNKKLIFIILPFFGITLKVTVLPLILISFYILFANKKSLLVSLKEIILIGLLFIFPWIVRNIILSGYILFPFEKLDLFSFDWKVPNDRVIETKNWIYSWARIPYRDQKEVLNLTFKEWFNVWWNATILKNKIFLVLSLISPFIIAYDIFKNKNWNKLVIIISIYLSLFLWLFTAPDFRFIFSVLLILIIFSITSIYFNLNYNYNFKKSILTLFLGLFVLYFYKNSLILFNEDYKNNFLIDYIYLPEDSYYIKKEKRIHFTIKELKYKNHIIEVFEANPKHSQCYDQFPCSPNIDGKLKLRGGEIETGFKIN